ncbi:hypothetical protein A3D00_02290 [Candidatus Woesebacteria bacterium RIFCSPHIGHO2_02_FULL_38_9]|uniref:N-acetyltransferase domain-containing protein n=1 Tax=Candidatus Woesebacteria bacterium RIFCSPHIGHO2_01_FULL_39_28 TaxID=1802496 RepID=A0A1F7YEF8_9BACT|nr:MAG: hypothetical protein A2627_04450 [Candidatus Woesebacteria bacterium RIFCSPHIGHO2_01_FULL_39_28]OGM33419.1 MAG: hypothetical protein A3D00_02290 [Candidatus Woesebacteria bacterium RIFCSPHIGHO2_02_FULL_38_9]OGM57779.1 MAG: hypothetical protein A3A50_05710 [Candidatus Woesebacteria bacterium RIFCSPLOWO2_01_FULL_38_20]
MPAVERRINKEAQVLIGLEPLSAVNVAEVSDFFRRQFNNPDEWCDLDELVSRLERKQEVVGMVDRVEEKVVGAVVAYRNPFSHDEWTVPIIAVQKAKPESNVSGFRGQGRGRALMEAVYGEIRTHGGKAVVADTNKLKERGGSKEFLEACGFRLIGEIPGYFTGEVNETGLMFVYHLNKT